MARRIEGVSDQLLRCAREEFMEMGFQEASLRVIAAKAGTSTGSIYTRYGDKDGLFRALTEEAVEGLIQSFESAQSASTTARRRPRATRWITPANRWRKW